MNKWHVLIGIALLALGWVLRSVTLTPQIREVPVTVTVPEIHNVTLPARIETVRVVRSVDVLRHDTVRVSLPGYRASLDTLLPYLVDIQQGDTVIRKEGLVGAFVDVSCIPSERAFILSTLRLQPLEIAIPTVDRVLTQGGNMSRIEAIIGSRGSIALMAGYNRFSLGYDYHPTEKRGEVRLGYRLFAF
jgi:hypothetical protein